MSPFELTAVSRLLNKTASKETSAIAGVWRAVRGAAKAGGDHLIGGGHKISGNLLKVTPHIAAAAGAKKIYDSEPVQRQVYRYRQWQAERAQRKAMGM